MLPIERLLGMLLASFCFSSVIVFGRRAHKITIVSFSGHAKVFAAHTGNASLCGTAPVTGDDTNCFHASWLTYEHKHCCFPVVHVH